MNVKYNWIVHISHHKVTDHVIGAGLYATEEYNGHVRGWGAKALISAEATPTRPLDNQHLIE